MLSVPVQMKEIEVALDCFNTMLTEYHDFILEQKKTMERESVLRIESIKRIKEAAKRKNDVVIKEKIETINIIRSDLEKRFKKIKGRCSIEEYGCHTELTNESLDVLFDKFDRYESTLTDLTANRLDKKRNSVQIKCEFQHLLATYNTIDHKLNEALDNLVLESNNDSDDGSGQIINTVEEELDNDMSGLQDQIKKQLGEAILMLKESLTELLPPDNVQENQIAMRSANIASKITNCTNTNPVIGTVSIDVKKHCNITNVVDRIITEYFGSLYESPILKSPIKIDTTNPVGLLLIYDESTIEQALKTIKTI